MESSKKNVTFTSMVQIIAAEPQQVDSEDDRLDKIWYNAAELAVFRDEVRIMCRDLRVRVSVAAAQECEQAGIHYSSPTVPKEDTHDNHACSMAFSAQTRGLESRVCMERQRRRYLATKCVVRAQSRLSFERLADLSFRCTRWASELAQAEAVQDYRDAYTVRPVEEDGTKDSVSLKRSRSFPQHSDATSQQNGDDDIFNPSRRVRQRLSL